MQHPPTTNREAAEVKRKATGSLSLPQQPTAKQYSGERSPQTEFHELNLLSPDQETVTIPPCPSCGGTQGAEIPGKGPHYAGVKCASCGRWLKWVGKPKTGGAA